MWLNENTRLWMVRLETKDRQCDMPPAEQLQYKDISIVLNNTGDAIRPEITAIQTGVKKVTLIWKAKLPFDAIAYADHWERGYGDLGWNGLDFGRVLPWYTIVQTKHMKIGIGVKTGPNAFCHWRISREWIQLTLDLRNGDSPLQLNGRRLSMAEIVTLEAHQEETAYAFAARFCHYLSKNPLLVQEPLYGGNNWYYAYGESSHNQILEDSKLIGELAGDNTTRPFMFVDDGWQICRAGDYIGGPWHCGNRRFPDMAKLAHQIKQEGVRPGLWLRPLMNIEKLPSTMRLPRERMLDTGVLAHLPVFLDPTIPEVMNLIREDIARIADWGYEFIKHDFTSFDLFGRWGFLMNDSITSGSWSFYDQSYTNAEVVKNLYRNIREAAGNAMVLGCNTIGHLAVGFEEAHRTGDDTSGKEWERTRKMGVNTLACRAMQHNSFFAADPDCVGITEHIPWSLNKRWMDLIANSGQMLMLSIQPGVLSSAMKKDVSDAISVVTNQPHKFEAVDWQRTSCPTEYIIGARQQTIDWDEM